MRSDLVAAVRSLAGAKTFTVVAITVLALGIGATTAIYSVVDGVLLRRLPFDESERLVALREHRPAEDPTSRFSITPQNFLDWDAQHDVFDALAALARATSVLTGPDSAPEDVRVARTTADFFDVLRTPAALGRVYRLDEEVDGRHRVAVISDGFWHRRFGADPSMLGATATLDGDAYEIVGVLPPTAAYPPGAASRVDLFVPLVVPPDERIRRPGVSASYLSVLGRLRQGVSLERARVRMDAVAAGLRAAHSEWNQDSHVRVVPLVDDVVGEGWASWLWMLFGAAACVLLITCVNVAVLQLTRAGAREHEMGVRAALGGGRARLIRQLLVENVVLALCGTVLAIVIAYWGKRFLLAAIGDTLPRTADIALDLRILVAMTVVAVACGIGFGLAPAWHLSTPRLAHAIKDGTRTMAGRASRRLARALIVVEIALAVVLLVAASLWTRSVLAIQAIDTGLATANVLTASIFPQRGAAPAGVSIFIGRSSTGPRLGDEASRFLDLVDRVQAAPGVVHAAFVAGGLPLSGSGSRMSVAIPGRTSGDDESVHFRRVTAGYHQALGIRVIAGRDLDARDQSNAVPVMVVNEALRRAHFDGEPVLGKVISIDAVEHEIVGVVPDVRQRLETAVEPEAVVLLTPEQRTRGGQLVIRMAGDAYAALPTIKAATADVFPGLPLRGVRSMEEVVAAESTWRRLDIWIADLFGILGLVIAAVGIVGTLAYGVERRTREIGVRMALGASASAVLRLVAAETVRTVGGGLAVGALAARWLLAGFESQWFEVSLDDPQSFVAAAVVLSLAAVLASVIPARRALDVSPAEALRVE